MLRNGMYSLLDSHSTCLTNGLTCLKTRSEMFVPRKNLLHIKVAFLWLTSIIRCFQNFRPPPPVY